MGGVEVYITLDLAPDGSHHVAAWRFRHGDRDVSESVLYWDEHFDYGGSSDDDVSGSADVDCEMEADMEEAAPVTEPVPALQAERDVPKDIARRITPLQRLAEAARAKGRGKGGTSRPARSENASRSGTDKRVRLVPAHQGTPSGK